MSPGEPQVTQPSGVDMTTQCTARTMAGAQCRNKCTGADKCHAHIINTCSICLEDFQRGFRTSCNHTFHSECMKRWAEKNTLKVDEPRSELVTSCPMCRTEVGVRMDISAYRAQIDYLAIIRLMDEMFGPQWADTSSDSDDDGEEVTSPETF